MPKALTITRDDLTALELREAAARSCGSRRERIPTAPTDAVTLPGHST